MEGRNRAGSPISIAHSRGIDNEKWPKIRLSGHFGRSAGRGRGWTAAELAAKYLMRLLFRAVPYS